MGDVDFFLNLSQFMDLIFKVKTVSRQLSIITFVCYMFSYMENTVLYNFSFTSFNISLLYMFMSFK